MVISRRDTCLSGGNCSVTRTPDTELLWRTSDEREITVMRQMPIRSSARETTDTCATACDSAAAPGIDSTVPAENSLGPDGPADRFGIPATEIERTREVLSRVLAPLSGKKVVLLVNRGNRGDGVIHMGGRELLRSLGLKWEEIYQPNAPVSVAADALLVFGNGAFCRSTHSMVGLIGRYSGQVGQVIILPASFDLRCTAVRRFALSWDRRFVVFCRERRSFDALGAASVSPAQLLLSHDLAFHADLRHWATRPGNGTVGIFRRDGEAVFDRRPRGLPGTDISRGPDSEPEVLLDYVARYAVVHTDRTHAAITAAMMGREVWLYRNSYFKNQAIFEHSLFRWPRVHFVGQQPFSFRQFGAALYYHYLQRNAFRMRRSYRRWKACRQAYRAGDTR